ncbi:MAG: AmmeMemoRadiSam system protein B [Gammaproteobacteria bacterium]|jgi:AmmeMemoRadiSam system protein B|nr:AmmeMemoRadiSam system protein B [Gammaproteobacteria bacterium]
MSVVREPAVAGRFYPEDPGELRALVNGLLEGVTPGAGVAPKALVAPHAGYIYSGAVAASAYSRLLPYRDTYRRVVLLGPCHRVPVAGMAVSGAEAFRTPLGDVPVDRETVAELEAKGIRVFEPSHQYEHSLEVQLPFLQTVLGEFSIVPVLVGEARPQAVAQLLEMLWGGPETLIVISSDLSHYLDYNAARSQDSRTCRRIEQLDADIGHEDACGATPLRGLLLAAKRRGMDVSTLDLRNSGDTEGDRDFVVGYGAWMFV